MTKNTHSPRCIFIVISLLALLSGAVYYFSERNKDAVRTHDDQHLFRVIVNGKLGFINKHGELKIPAVYENVGFFPSGLAHVLCVGRDPETGYAQVEEGQGCEQMKPVLIDNS